MRNAFAAASGRPDEGEFKPHLTLAKMSRDFSAAKKVKRFNDELYADFAQLDFGAQSIESECGVLC